MIKLSLSPSEIAELNFQRFYHPDPLVMKRCDTVYLHAMGLKTGQLHELTGREVKTIRTHLHLYNNGGIGALKERQPYCPKSELDQHKPSIEQAFRVRPPASVKEAGERMFQLTGIRRSDGRIEVFLKRSGMKFRKTGGIPAKADLAQQEEFLKKN
jgi:transposase